MTKKDALVYLSMISGGEFDKIMELIHDDVRIDPFEAEKLVSTLDCQTVTILDPNYPEAMKHMFAPPVVLYYYGNFELMNQYKRTYAYVGSREPDQYAKDMARKISKECADLGLILVNGMARGIDGESLRGALEAKGKCIAVLGCGIDNPYPISNKDIYAKLKLEGLIVSEYPPGIEPSPEKFPDRNRIVVGLSKGVVIGSSKEKSGTMITAKLAADNFREVGAVPYRATDDNICNQLIKSGVYLIESGQDVLDMIGGYAVGKK